MTVSLFRASWRVVAQPPVLVPTAAAVLLALATTPFLDAGNAHQVRIGVATLLACALAATAEDPAGEVAAASPHPRRVRCGVRLILGLALVLPVVALSLILIERQVAAIRTPGAAVQMLAILAVGPAIGFAVWAWVDMAQPSYAAMTGVLCCSLAMLLLPTTWSVIKVQPWGPPWEAVMVRWFAMVGLGAAIVANAWRDPNGAGAAEACPADPLPGGISSRPASRPSHDSGHDHRAPLPDRAAFRSDSRGTLLVSPADSPHRSESEKDADPPMSNSSIVNRSNGHPHQVSDRKSLSPAPGPQCRPDRVGLPTVRAIACVWGFGSRATSRSGFYRSAS